MDKICNGCEWSTGKECTLGYSDPFFNACQHVSDIVNDCVNHQKFKTTGIFIEIKSCKECHKCLKIHSGPTVTWRCGFTKKRRAVAHNIEYIDEEP